MKNHEKYIKRCISLAKNGLGNTYPNPMVGSVIVYKDKIVGEGWHQKSGEPHAEVNAIRSVRDESILSKSTMYVSLEPCIHFGKTPPCSHLIVEKGIKNVVIGALDVNELVSGKGVEYLRNHNCNVTTGVLEEECKNLNKRFFTFHNYRRPYIVLKWAETKDGFIDRLRTETSEKKPNWISNSYSQQMVHKMRVEEQAILVGTNTVINDNPKLTARSWFGKHPVRIFIDRSLRVPEKYNLFDGSIATFLITDISNIPKCSAKNVEVVGIDFSENIVSQICDFLFEKGLQSVVVEGGLKTLQTFIDENCWDEAHIFTGNTFFKKGLQAPKIEGKLTKSIELKKDILKVYIPKKQPTL